MKTVKNQELLFSNSSLNTKTVNTDRLHFLKIPTTKTEPRSCFSWFWEDKGIFLFFPILWSVKPKGLNFCIQKATKMGKQGPKMGKTSGTKRDGMLQEKGMWNPQWTAEGP